MVTALQLEPILTTITTNVTSLLPICIGVFSLIVGVSLIPKLIKRFL